MAAASPSSAPPKLQPPQSPSPLESTTVAAEYGRIFNPHPRHFLILSLLFLPISFSPFLLPTFHKISLSSIFAAQIIPLLISCLFISTSYLLAIGSITHSVRHAFHYTTPLTLTSSIKSSIYSFFPLFTTALSINLTRSDPKVTLNLSRSGFTRRPWKPTTLTTKLSGDCSATTPPQPAVPPSSNPVVTLSVSSRIDPLSSASFISPPLLINTPTSSPSIHSLIFVTPSSISPLKSTTTVLISTFPYLARIAQIYQSKKHNLYLNSEINI